MGISSRGGSNDVDGVEVVNDVDIDVDVDVDVKVDEVGDGVRESEGEILS